MLSGIYYVMRTFEVRQFSINLIWWIISFLANTWLIFNETMRKKITLETVIDVVKLSVFLSWCWPLPKDATKLKVTCATLYQYMTLLSNLSLTLALFNMVRNHFNDPVIIAKALMFMAAITHVVLSIAVYRINCHRLQVINTNIFNVNVFFFLS